MSEEIRIEVKRNKGDYFSAIAANFFHSGGVWWTVIGAVAFFVVIFAMGYMMEDPEPWRDAALGVAGYLAAMVVLNTLIMWITAAKSARQPGALEPITYVFTPQALEVKAAIGSGVTQWIAYKRAFENSRVLVIRHHVNIMQFLPKRDIPRDAMPRLRQLLRGALNGRVSFKQEQSS